MKYLSTELHFEAKKYKLETNATLAYVSRRNSLHRSVRNWIIMMYTRATDLDPLLVSSASRSAVAVRGKCRHIRLLSGAVSMHPPFSCRGGQLVLSPHTRMPRHHV